MVVRGGHTLSAAASHKGRLAAVFCITLGILGAEIVDALISGSLALFADAAHMFTDVAAIGLSLLAIRFAARPATAGRTFGYYRVEILAAVCNAVLLFGAAVVIVVEAVSRLVTPPDVASGIMIAFGILALAGNAVSLWLMRAGQRESLNIRGVFLEVASDMLGALAVVVSGVVIAVFGLHGADAVASILIAALILPRTWRLLRDAVDVLLEATPKGVDMDDVRHHIVETQGVVDAHDLHVWCLTSGMNVVSAHVVVEPGADHGIVLDRLTACLGDHFDVEHSTFQIEYRDRRDVEEASHP